MVLTQEKIFLEFMKKFRLNVKIAVQESKGCKGQLIIGVFQFCRAELLEGVYAFCMSE